MSCLRGQTLTPELPRSNSDKNPAQISPENVQAELGTPSKTAIIEAGESRKKKVIKKTVRIVKRIVKKKVAKRVSKNSAGNEELVKDVIVDENGSFEPCLEVCTSNIKNLETGGGNNVKPHVEGEDLIQSDPQPMEVENASICEDALPESDGKNGSELPKAEKPLKDLKEKTNFIENQDVGNEGIGQDDTVVSVDENAKSIEDWRFDLAGEAETRQSLEGVSEVLESDVEWSDKVTSREAAGTKDSLDEVKEVLQSDIECSEKITLSEEMDPLERDVEWTDKVTLRDAAGTKDSMDEVKEVLQSDIECSEKVTLSEEMEALERRMKRRTQIFIGGLHKDTREEDIRLVFEEVGEIIELILLINHETGKNKGYAFLRFASAADAKKAVTKYSQVKIRGKQCGVSLARGNDTIFLGNIDKKLKTQDVVELLEKACIDKIDKVTVMADPNNAECNRGFAFVELETNRDAQLAFNKLIKKDVFGKHLQVKVAWAEPLVEPDEEEIQKVKSVYAEHIPLSWDKAKVTDYFKKFGEIENVVIAKDLPSSRRKDFAFVNYTSREAALACIMAFKHEQQNDDSSEVKVKVSLARPMLKSKQTKRAINPTIKEPSREMIKVARSITKIHKPIKKEKPLRSDYGSCRVDSGSSSTDELLRRLRQQTSTRQIQSGLNTGSTNMGNWYSSPGSKRPLPLVVRDDPLHSENRGFPRIHLESSLPIPNGRVLSRTFGAPSAPLYHLQDTTASGSTNMENWYSSSGRKRPLPLVGDDPLHSENRGFPRIRLESSLPINNGSVLSRTLGAPSAPHYHLQGTHASDSSIHGVAKHGRPYQTHEPSPYGGVGGIYHRY